MEGIFVYFLENISSTLMRKSSKSEGRYILKVIQAFHIVPIVLHIGCYGPVTGSWITFKLIIFRPSTTGTMPLTSHFA